MDERLHQTMLKRLEDGKLPCIRAFAIARSLGLDPLTVGMAADEAGIRISRCQLGLFGYGPKAEGKHKIVRPMEHVPAALEQAIRGALDAKGLPCVAAWEIAKRMLGQL